MTYEQARLFFKLKRKLLRRIWRPTDRVPSACKDWCLQQQAPSLTLAERYLTEHGLLYEPIDAMVKKWPQLEKELFRQYNTPELHYENWDKNYGAYNIPANILDQFHRPYIVYKLIKYLSASKKTILDYGCGTASLSISWCKEYAPDAKLILADIPNTPREFVKWRIKESKQVSIADLDLNSIVDVDAVLCIDVLEHLRNPSEIFNIFHKKLRSGGLLFLQAPWGGHITHLDEAPVDWYSNGGYEILSENYKKIDKLNHDCITSGVYQKNKNKKE